MLRGKPLYFPAELYFKSFQQVFGVNQNGTENIQSPG
jgi:hypothetical protein